MKLAEKIAADLNTLDPGQVLMVHDLIHALKSRHAPSSSVKASAAYRRVRKALARCKGNISDDIVALRDDRV